MRSVLLTHVRRPDRRSAPSSACAPTIAEPTGGRGAARLMTGDKAALGKSDPRLPDRQSRGAGRGDAGAGAQAGQPARRRGPEGDPGEPGGAAQRSRQPDRRQSQRRRHDRRVQRLPVPLLQARPPGGEVGGRRRRQGQDRLQGPADPGRGLEDRRPRRARLAPSRTSTSPSTTR